MFLKVFKKSTDTLMNEKEPLVFEEGRFFFEGKIRPIPLFGNIGPKNVHKNASLLNPNTSITKDLLQEGNFDYNLLGRSPSGSFQEK